MHSIGIGAVMSESKVFQTVRIAYYGDSGPHGEWSRVADTETERWDGFGKTEIRGVPASLWAAYADARDAASKAMNVLERWMDRKPMIDHQESTGHKCYPNPDSNACGVTQWLCRLCDAKFFITWEAEHSDEEFRRFMAREQPMDCDV